MQEQIIVFRRFTCWRLLFFVGLGRKILLPTNFSSFGFSVTIWGHPPLVDRWHKFFRESTKKKEHLFITSSRCESKSKKSLIESAGVQSVPIWYGGFQDLPLSLVVTPNSPPSLSLFPDFFRVLDRYPQVHPFNSWSRRESSQSYQAPLFS